MLLYLFMQITRLSWSNRKKTSAAINIINLMERYCGRWKRNIIKKIKSKTTVFSRDKLGKIPELFFGENQVVGKHKYLVPIFNSVNYNENLRRQTTFVVKCSRAMFLLLRNLDC